MARYTGPKSKISRRFAEPIFGASKALQKKAYPPGMHGRGRRKKQSEYAVQLMEKQKVKYLYGMLEKQFENLFHKAAAKGGITGENLLALLESRLDNTVYRLGIAPTRSGARQLVSHKHLLINGESVNIPSYRLKPGDTIELKPKSKANTVVTGYIRPKNIKINWVDFNEKDLKGTYMAHPERENVPENIKEQLIVELYSK